MMIFHFIKVGEKPEIFLFEMFEQVFVYHFRFWNISHQLGTDRERPGGAFYMPKGFCVKDNACVKSFSNGFIKRDLKIF